MFKSQMKFQKILCLLALIMAAVMFVYALGFITDWYDLLYFTLDLDEGIDFAYVDGTQFFWELQTYLTKETVDGQTTVTRHTGFVEDLITVSIVGILIAVFMLITRNNTRRKYYVSNYVSTGMYCVFNVGFAVWLMDRVTLYKSKFLQINFEMLEKYCKMWKIEYYPTTRWCDCGYVLGALLIAFSLAVAANLVWKIALTRRENKLLSQGRSADVAATVA